MSLDVPRSRLGAQRRAEDWESWKSLIRDRFLVKKMDVDAITAELHHRGFDITKPQLENRLTSWGIRRKLKPEIWRTVKSDIVARVADRKQSVVILSGLRLPAEKMDYEMKRNELVTMRPAPNPEAIPEDIRLYVSTPRSSSTDLTIRPDLPEDLPWLQFSRTHLPAVLGRMRFAVLSGKTITIPATGHVADSSLSQFAHQGSIVLSKSDQSALFPVVLQKIVWRSLVNLIGSEKITVQLLGRKSIDCLAARLDLALPETYRDENVYRVSIWSADTSRNLCRLSGLAERRTIDNVVRRSRTSPTLTAMVDAIFAAAVNTEAVDFVEHLLAIDERIHPERKIGLVPYQDIFGPECFTERGSPLQLAVVRGSIELVKVLLDRGADIHQRISTSAYPYPRLSLTAAAALQPSRILSRKTVKLLVERGADINENQTPPWSARASLSPLHAAILMGDTDLIKFLVATGAHVNHRHMVKEYGPRLHDFLWHPYRRRLHGFIWHPFDGVVCNMHDVGCLGIATLFGCYIGHANPQSTDHQERQKKVLDLCQWLFKNFPSCTDLSGYEIKDAMILAAAQGYSDVVSFLYSQDAASLDAASGNFSPMIAAVTFGNTDTCRLLLKLGASSSQHEMDREFFEAKPYLLLSGEPDIEPAVVAAPPPHLLHMAVASNCCDIVKLLIEHGADVDEVSCSDCCRAASLLAARGGSLELVSQLVRRGIDQNDAISAFQTALVHGHGEIAEILFESAHGALDLGGIRWLHKQQSPETQADDGERSSLLECAILSGWSKAIKKAFSLDTTTYDSGALCAAVYMAVIQRRLPDEDYVLGELLHRRDQDMGRTLPFAVQSRNEEIIIALLDAGYEADSFTLRLAVSMQLTLSLIQRLTEHCTNVDPFCAMDDDSKWIDKDTPLQIAAWRGRTDIASVLLSHGAKINEIRPRSDFWDGTQSALTEAIKNKQWPTVSFLLDRGSDVNGPVWSPKQPFVTSPLQLAAKAGYIGIVRRLLADGADVNAQRSMLHGYTALEGAAMAGRIDTVSLLLASNVHTEGYGRVQFVKAIFEASKKEHGAAVAILRSHRPWTAEDQSIWEELEQEWDRDPWFLHPAEHSPGELVNIIATVQDKKPESRWQKPFCPQDWSKSAATEVLKYANIVIAEHPEITASDAEDNAARVAETAFLDCIGKQLKPGFWLGHVFGRSEKPEQALNAVSRALQEWASSMRSADVPDESDTLGDGAQLSWDEDLSGDATSGVEDFAMGACDEINTFEDMEDVVEHGENQGEARGKFRGQHGGFLGRSETESHSQRHAGGRRSAFYACGFPDLNGICAPEEWTGMNGHPDNQVPTC
ncbi:ankyrin repeat-containing domain protein [Rhypophila decipiens]|uniref:Ankyrin repeat-containing domain protein n=1 Tax=Rhypophila decipiens TaxID=261697 RepID=A0AAN7BG41_9PEZI|nr:ankyrin repeat-containing domain protein [Rhypophila decipiens]